MKSKNLFTIGELAKKMNITVRTLQYYDKENLLHPSFKSEGGRRLYSEKDMVKLHQILSLKHLGFSLDEIRDKLLSLDDPIEVSKLLKSQSEVIRSQIQSLTVALETTEKLYEEVLNIKTVDFSKYADIISLLKEKNENYWVIKLFDDKLSSHIRNNFEEKGTQILNTYKTLLNKFVELKTNGESPYSKNSIKNAELWWNMIIEFTGGDMSLLPNLMKFNNDKEHWNKEFASKQLFIDDFLETSLSQYFKENNIVILELESD